MSGFKANDLIIAERSSFNAAGAKENIYTIKAQVESVPTVANRGNWNTLGGITYYQFDVVTYDAKQYICVLNHYSTLQFKNDLAKKYWELWDENNSVNGYYNISLVNIQDASIFENNSDGIEFIRIGNSTDLTRQGSIEISSDKDDAPYIIVRDGINSFAKLDDPTTIRFIAGKLTGRQFAGNTIGNKPDGSPIYGLMTDNGYFKGTLAVGNVTDTIISGNWTMSGIGNFANNDGYWRVGNPGGHFMKFNPITGQLQIKGNVEITNSSYALDDLSNVVNNTVANKVNSATTLIQPGRILLYKKDGTTETDLAAWQSLVKQWQHASDLTVIDGGKIFTYSVTANKISVNTLSELTTNAGVIISGKLQNTSGSNFLNLNATGSGNFIQIGTRLAIQADSTIIAKNEAGTSYIKLDPTGLYGYNSALGAYSFIIPTDPTQKVRFSHGLIESVEWTMTNQAVIKTSSTAGDGTAASAGVVINQSGFFAMGANQTTANANVKILQNGNAEFLGSFSSGTLGESYIEISSSLSPLIKFNEYYAGSEYSSYIEGHNGELHYLSNFVAGPGWVGGHHFLIGYNLKLKVGLEVTEITNDEIMLNSTLLGFFGALVAPKTTIADLSGSEDLAGVRTKLQNLIDALQSYGLV